MFAVAIKQLGFFTYGRDHVHCGPVTSWQCYQFMRSAVHDQVLTSNSGQMLIHLFSPNATPSSC
jgi:hypothetical protein